MGENSSAPRPRRKRNHRGPGTILDWIPVQTRLTDPDPQKLGVGKMIEKLRHLSQANSDIEVAMTVTPRNGK